MPDGIENIGWGDRQVSPPQPTLCGCGPPTLLRCGSRRTSSCEPKASGCSAD